MKIASSPMSAIEALQLDAAYVAVAKSLGLPTQSYMALSDGPILDAQAGAETFGSALIAALAGRQLGVRARDARLPARVQPAQARLRRRDVRPGAALRPRGQAARRPAGRRADRPADGRPAPDHGRRTRRPTGRPSSTCRARSSIATTARRGCGSGRKDTYQRACDEVDRRLAAYRQLETDPAIDAELRAHHQVRARRARTRPAGHPGRPGAGRRDRPRAGERRHNRRRELRRRPRRPGGSRRHDQPDRDTRPRPIRRRSTSGRGTAARRSSRRRWPPGCSAYDIYNHMYLPGYYADPIEEYWALLNDVTVWDVVGRADRRDHRARTRRRSPTC